MRKAYMCAGLAVLVVAGLLLAPHFLSATTQAVIVTPRDLVRSVVATGRVEAPHRVDLGSPIVGTVARVYAEAGQVVRQGQTIIQLDDAELNAGLRAAELAVAQAQARVRQLREVQSPVAGQAVRQAQATLENARAQLKRQEDLFRQGFIGQAALDETRKNLALAEAQLGATHRQFETTLSGGSDDVIATASLAQARANADGARARLQHASITAPVDGVLISREVEPGDVVQPGKVLMVLSPTGSSQLIVQFDEKNLGLLAVGQKALASADAFADRRFAAEVVYISAGVDAQRGSVEVKLRVPEPPAYLRENMTVSVDVEVARRSRALAVPLELLHDMDSSQPSVLQVIDGRARRKGVKLGLRGAGYVEVVGGLAAGDQLAPAGTSEGARVKAATPPP